MQHQLSARNYLHQESFVRYDFNPKFYMLEYTLDLHKAQTMASRHARSIIYMLQLFRHLHTFILYIKHLSRY